MSTEAPVITATLANPEKGIVALVYPDGTMHTCSVPMSESMYLIGSSEDFSLYATSILPENHSPGVLQVFPDRHVEHPIATPFQIVGAIPSESNRIFGFHIFGYGACLFDAQKNSAATVRMPASATSMGIRRDGSLLVRSVKEGKPMSGLLRNLPISDESEIPSDTHSLPEGAVGYTHIPREGAICAVNRATRRRGVAVLFHGGPISCHSPLYDPLVDRLASEGYLVILPTYPCSTGILNPLSPQGNFRKMALAAIHNTSKMLARYAKPHEEIILVGRSFGAWTALLAPSQGMRADRVLAISPPIGISGSLSKQESNAGLDYLDALVVVGGQRPSGTLAETYSDVERQDLSSEELAALGDIPVHIAHNTHDPVTAFSGQRRAQLEAMSNVSISHSDSEGHATSDLMDLVI